MPKYKTGEIRLKDRKFRNAKKGMMFYRFGHLSAMHLQYYSERMFDYVEIFLI